MIIVGLGNPGPDYLGTRHNIGFEILDQLADALGVSWSAERDVLAARTGDHWLIKPQTYMNRSGHAIRDFLVYKNISIESADLHQHLLVIHDELDFAVGQWKVQRDRSSAGHNGVQSIIDALSTKDFQRVRVGIGNGKAFNIPSEDFVLQSFPHTDRILLNLVITEIVDTVRQRLQTPTD